MNKLKLYITSILLCYTALTFGQSSYQMSFYVVDKQSKQPLKNARVAVKELGYQSQISGSDGMIYFQSLPVGEIHYFVSADGYNGFEKSFNVTTIEKNNTYKIELSKIPTSNMLLVSGEITDMEGNEIEDAQIELRGGGLVKTGTSDKSGFFNIEFDLGATNYAFPELLLEITKNECKQKDRFTIPKNNTMYREIRLQCSTKEIEPPSIKDFKKTIGEWEIELVSCQKTGNSITCDFIITSKFRDRTVTLYSDKVPNYSKYPKSLLYDNMGNEYTANNAQLSNTQNPKYITKRLIADISTKASLTFPNVSTQATKIALLEVYLEGDNLTENKIQFRDIEF